MYGFYVHIQLHSINLILPLLLLYALESAIQGHVGCMNLLIGWYQDKAKPLSAMALASLWTKIKTQLDDTDYIEEERKRINKMAANSCYVCGKEKTENNNDVTLVTCDICKYCSYCGKDCQTRSYFYGNIASHHI